MKFIEYIRSSISLKLLLSFLVVVVLSVFALLLTLNALNKTREAQYHLTQEALPLLLRSQDFSKALFNYLTLLERASITQDDDSDLVNRLAQREKDMLHHLDLLQKSKSVQTAEVKALLEQILNNSTELQMLVFTQKPQQISAVNEEIKKIRLYITGIGRTIRHYQITHHRNDEISTQQNAILSIGEEVIRINEILSQYKQTINAEEIKYLQSRYTVAVRRITQSILQIRDADLQKKIAQDANQLFEQSINDKGFFAVATKLDKNIRHTIEIVRKNKLKEQEVNLFLGQLLNKVSGEADAKLKAFDEFIKKDIAVLGVTIIGVMFISSFILYFYIVPKVTRRLNRLANDTRCVSSGQYETVIDTAGVDEIAQMASALDGFKQALIEKEKSDKEREQLVVKLVDSNEELERFAFVCSHDLQEPLRMIRSFSEKLQQHMGESFESDEKGKKYFRFITEGAARAQALITDVLSYSSIDRDAQTLENVNSESLVGTVKENMHLYLDERKAQVSFDKLPELRGNKTQLFQLFQNLINNGIKYQTSDNIPKVHIAVEDKGEYWQFSIKDNGIGMEERHLKKIFDVFQRLNRKSQYAGTGVGLSICKKVVERHGGSIWVTSEKEVGSIFYFTLLKEN